MVCGKKDRIEFASPSRGIRLKYCKTCNLGNPGIAPAIASVRSTFAFRKQFLLQTELVGEPATL